MATIAKSVEVENHMVENQACSRLSRITTAWTLVVQAHQDEEDLMQQARCSLMERYVGAAYRYLLGAARDPDVADELIQEFAIRFLRGGFRRADPERGRFRDFVKTALSNLVNDHYRRENRRLNTVGGPVLEEPYKTEADLDEAFVESWREELIAKAWDELEAVEEARQTPYHRLLKQHSEHPELKSSQLAEWLNAEFQPEKPFTDVGVRKLIQRGREMLADFVVDEVSHSLGGGTLDEVEEELIDIGLISYCRAVLDRRCC